MKLQQKEKAILFIMLVLSLALVSFSVYVLITTIIDPVIIRGLLFICVMAWGIVSMKLYFVYSIQSVMHHFKFALITPFYRQTRLEGNWKKQWWQIHYVSKESGTDPGILRTYIKLQYKKPMQFHYNVLQKYVNLDYENKRIITVKHITRPYKNYLLMKIRYLQTEPLVLEVFMNKLMEIAKEAKR